MVHGIKLLTLLLAATFFLQTTQASFAEPGKIRHIDLSPEAGSLLERQGASGRVSIMPQDLVPFPATTPFLEVTVRNIPCQVDVIVGGNGRTFYALYIDTLSTGRIRVVSFNTTCAPSFHFTPLLPFKDDAWFADPMTIEVLLNEDDSTDDHIPSFLAPNFILRGVDP